MTKEIPSSRNIWRGESQSYWITAAEWNGIYGPSYEIGIRQKEGEQTFYLIQGPWREMSIQKVAEATRVLLDAGFTPTELVEEVFRS